MKLRMAGHGNEFIVVMSDIAYGEMWSGLKSSQEGVVNSDGPVPVHTIVFSSGCKFHVFRSEDIEDFMVIPKIGLKIPAKQ